VDPFDPNNAEFQEAIRQADLLDQYRLSPQLAIRSKIRSFGTSRGIFEANYDELRKCIEHYAPKSQQELLRWATDVAHRRQHLFEVTRLLHNFLAAAASLIDHARVFYRKMYRAENLMPDYQAKILAEFASDPLAQFIVCLRQYCLHYQTPVVFVSVSMNNITGVIGSGTTLDKAKLLLFDNWNAAARKFLDQSPDSLDLVVICSTYYDKVKGFYIWFEAEQSRIHKGIFDYLNEMERQLNFGPEADG
jgi:hypothetical protein